MNVLPRLAEPAHRVARALGAGVATMNAWQSMAADREARRERGLLQPTAADRPDRLTAISEPECWELLAGHEVGRIAFTAHSRTPVIVPVNYAVDGRSIVLRSGRGPKLAAAARGDAVAFEVDAIDLTNRCGWSVSLTGPARWARSAEECARLERLGLRPWAAGPREQFVVIEPRHVAGRRLTGRCAGGQPRAR